MKKFRELLASKLLRRGLILNGIISFAIILSVLGI